MTLREELDSTPPEADSMRSMNVSYPTPFCTTSPAPLTTSATLGLAS
jgi:hypothetical protein